MPSDPQQLEAFLSKLASDDEFRASAAADPHAVYSEHNLKYSGDGAIPAKEHAQSALDTLKTPADAQDDRIFADKIFADKIFADKIFADKIFLA